MGGGVEHGGEAEEIAVFGLGEEDFLALLIHGGDADGAGEDEEGVFWGVAGLVDALAGFEVAEFDLLGEDAEFVFVEEGKERNVAEFFGVDGHGRLVVSA